VFQVDDHFVTPTGAELLRRSLTEIVEWLLIAGGIRRLRQQPSRNELIRLRFATGETLSELAGVFGITPQRVYQIVNLKGK
jgi:DNA-directed RNA polymerase sigma subunit (sigma70/sigma32)